MGTSPASELNRRLRWVLLALFAVLAFGVIGYMTLQDWSFLDSLYMTVITLTTVGFREVRPLDDGGRLFTIILLVMGVGLALVMVSLLARVVAESQVGARSRRRRMQRHVEEMRNHTIICAYGRVGRAAARALERTGQPFVVIDPQEDLRERMEEDGVPYLIDDPSSEAVLKAAGVERASSMLCAVDSDAVNVYITLTARALRPDLTIVARASEPGSPERLARAGADRVVSPFVSSGEHMAVMALRPEIVDVLGETGGVAGTMSVEERAIDDRSPLVGSTVAGCGLRVLAIQRASGDLVANPADSEPLLAGDTVLTLAVTGGTEATP